VSDLFGADLPVEGGDGGQFAWRDGPFLQALKAGHWILLDEVNVGLHIVTYSGCSIHDGTLLHSKSQYTTVKHSQQLFEHM
jgi:midasin